MKVDFSSPAYIAHMVEGQLSDIECLRSQIEKALVICEEWLAILENLGEEEKLLQELKSRLEEA